MGRCSCGGGATCACVVEGVGNVAVTGAGTSSSPYQISVTGDYSANMIVQDTDTVDLSLTGIGSAQEPFMLQASATVRMEDLTDVNDPEGGPQSGEVPVWIVDHWEFQQPPTVPVGAIATGPGIIGDGSGISPLLAAVSGIWGQGSMAGFPTDQQLGVPIYTDDTGQLRARPIPVVRHAEDPIQTYAAGWGPTTSGNAGWVQWGALVYVLLDFTRTGASIPASSTGNPGNINITDVNGLRAAMPSPVLYSALGTGMAGQMIGTFLSPTKAVQLGNTVPNIGINNGARFMVSGIYLGNVQPVL